MGRMLEPVFGRWREEEGHNEVIDDMNKGYQCRTLFIFICLQLEMLWFA